MTQIENNCCYCDTPLDNNLDMCCSKCYWLNKSDFRTGIMYGLWLRHNYYQYLDNIDVNMKYPKVISLKPRKE